MTIGKLIDAFLAGCRRNGRSPKTIRFYESRLKLFREKFSSRDICSIKSLELKEFLHESGQGYSDSTRHHNAVAITSLHSFALSEEMLDKPWFLKNLPKPPIGRRERIPSAEEIAKLLYRASPEFTLIYTGLSQSGARPGELCRATIADVDWNKKRILLLEHKTAAKTGRPRIIAIGGHFAATLRTAIADRTEGAVFLNARGQAWTVEHLSGMHRQLRDAAGLEKTIVLYSARHRFGTELVRAKKPLKDVADLMGHSSVTMTEKYLHRDVTELAADQDDVPAVGGPQ